MEQIILNMAVEKNDGPEVLITIRSGLGSVAVKYDRTMRMPCYLSEGPLTDLLRENEKQFRKVLGAKNRAHFLPGDSLDFVIMKNKDVHAFSDPARVIIIDRRDGTCSIEVRDSEDTGIHILYADGSYMPRDDKGAIAALLDLRNDTCLLHAEPVEERNSNLIEMLSVIRGLEALPVGRAVRIVSDSMYVRKGLSEWMFNWKLNDWRTATGRKARHIDYWKRLDRLTADRRIELQWVKGNSGDRYQALCDQEARRAAVTGLPSFHTLTAANATDALP